VLRWGVLGAAAIVRQEVGPALAASPHAQPVAIGSRRPAAAAAIAAELGARAHDSYRAVVEAPDVDAVYVALPNAEHREWVLAALAAGKHVLCEKPLGMSAAETRELADAARAAGRVLLEGLMWRHGARVRRVRELLRDGAIGELRHVRVRYAVRSRGLDDPAVASSTFRFSRALGGGALADLGCYCADAALLFAGGAPESVEAWRRVPAGAEVETAVDARLAFADDVVVHLFATMESPGGSVVELLGTGGRIALPTAFRTRPADAPLRVEIAGAAGTRVERSAFEDLYARELEHVARIVHEDAAPVVPLAESVRTAAVLDDIRAAWVGGHRSR